MIWGNLDREAELWTCLRHPPGPAQAISVGQDSEGWIICFYFIWRASLVAELVKNPPAMWDTWVWSLGWEDPLEKGKAPHSSILAWRTPWSVQFKGSQRVGQDWMTSTNQFNLRTALWFYFKITHSTNFWFWCWRSPVFSNCNNVFQIKSQPSLKQTNLYELRIRRYLMICSIV